MDKPRAGIRDQTLALDTLIRETVSQIKGRAHGEQTDTMLFLGNRHYSFPALVVQDPVLEPVDKLVWMAIMLAVTRNASAIAFPSYEAIGRMANVASRSTVARAIAILRTTRWLTLCARVRNAAGRYCGNVYALHDEPLPLADALHLDSGYMTFLSRSKSHGHARVRAVAKGLLASMDEDIQEGAAVAVREHPIERRIKALSQIDERGGPRRFFDFTENVVQGLRARPSCEIASPEPHDQNSNLDRSSSYINNTTTTTQQASETNSAQSANAGTLLVYPRRLTHNQREVADRYLRKIDASQHQAVLDELEGRYRAEEKGMAPLYDELRFLHALCKAVRDGKFQANLGIRVRSERESAKKIRDTVVAPTKGERAARRARHRKGVAELKAQLGLLDETGKEELTRESSSQ